MTFAAVFLTTALLCQNFGRALALEEPGICYILDGILFVYGIVLTALYCRLKMGKASGKSGQNHEKQEDGIYTSLTPRGQDTYETLNIQRK
ncbi:high affinity immunoglobulin epsilon receptor subunit gamma-like [Megalops cyprinoides]|uniref:high affinity immunoglobulin epsilon receptor subunit gamma-like n=1 Tax=Megalops cyprinoides TaxID=118141 RepID=UPI001864859F|nr:high affinity immunoglobulin epsilon receptor subunit gamma-like [Megalops cyprinoides]